MIKALLIQPGKTVRDFLSGNGSNLVKPFLFLIVTSVIYALVSHFFYVDGKHINSIKLFESTAIGGMLIWMTKHFGFVNIFIGIFSTFLIRSFFKKYNTHYREIIILLSFVLGFGMIVFTLFAILQGILHTNVQIYPVLFSIAYTTFAVADFYDRTKFMNYVKSFLAYYLGLILFSFSAGILTIFIDLCRYR